MTFRRYLAGFISMVLLLSLPLSAVADLHVEPSGDGQLMAQDHGMPGSAPESHDADGDGDAPCGGEHCCTDLCTAALIPVTPQPLRARHSSPDAFLPGMQMPPLLSFYKPPRSAVSH